ncbi:MAG: VWA-like domain-containing protein [Oscillospiraceae bacterium]|nr:VWA-like domain-containing protein [Oscillospiraceae bacterium]
MLEQSKFRAIPFSYKLARFSLLLRKAYPFLGELCMRVDKHHKEQRGLASTDGLRIYLNEEKLNELHEEALNFVLLHELFHIILRHQYPQGMPFYARIYWNIGFDLHTNWLLMSMQNELTNKGLPVMPTTDMMLATDDLSEDPSHTIAKAFVQQAVEQGITSENPPLFVEIGWKSFKTTVLNNNLFVFDVLDKSDIADAPTEADISELLLSCAKSAGREGLPWHLRGLWDELRKERTLPWHLIFRNFLEDMKESGDFDFCPPDKRMLYSELILPSETIEEGGELNNALIVLDVSSSVNRAELLAQIQQVYSVLNELGIRGSIISFGSSVYQEAIISNKASLKKFIDELEVGGGTDWSDVVKYVKQNKQRAKPIIVFTDGYFSSYDEGLSNVVFITQGDYPEDLCRLGKVIQINHD